MKIPAPLQEVVRRAHSNIDSFIRSIVGKGDDIEWSAGPYKGRRAKVDSVYWDHWSWEVCVYVKTYRKDGKGFLATHDRKGHSLSKNFEPINKRGVFYEHT